MADAIITAVVLDASELLDSLEIAKAIDKSNSAIVRFYADAEVAYVEAATNVLGVRLYVPADLGPSIDARVKLGDLSRAVKSAGPGDIEIAQTSQTSTSDVELWVGEKMLPGAERFTELDFDEVGDVFVWADAGFAAEIQRAVAFASTDEHRPALQSVHLDHTNAEEGPRLIATDAYHMLVVPLDKQQVTAGTDVLVSAKLLENATLGVGEDGAIQLQAVQEGAWTRAVLEGEVWLAKNPIGVATDWRHVITERSYAEGPFQIDADLDRETLLGAVNNTLSGAVPQAKMSFVVAGASLTTTALGKRGSDIIDVVEIFVPEDVTVPEDGYEFILDPRLLKHIADALDGGDGVVTFRQMGPELMALFDDGVRMCLQMPCRRRPGAVDGEPKVADHS